MRTLSALWLLAFIGCGSTPMPTSPVGTWRVTGVEAAAAGDPSTCVARTSTNDMTFAVDMSYSTQSTTVYSTDVSLCGSAPSPRAGCTETSRGTGQTWTMMASSASERAITSVAITGAGMGTNEMTGCVDPTRNRAPMTNSSADRTVTGEYRVDADTMVFQGVIYRRVTM